MLSLKFSRHMYSLMYNFKLSFDLSLVAFIFMFAHRSITFLFLTVNEWSATHMLHTSDILGAVHKWRHAIFGDFWPPLSQTVTNLWPPP